MSEHTPVSVKHLGTIITYDEFKDCWRYEFNGRERSAKSLANAKANIEKPPPADKVPFVRRKAYGPYGNYSREISEIEVTGLAESPPYVSYKEVWVKGPKGERSKQRTDSLYAFSPKNTKTIGEIAAIDAQIEQLREAKANLVQSMERLVIEGA